MSDNINKDDRKYYKTIYSGLILLFLMAIIAIFSSIDYANKNYQNDVNNWFLRLDVTAETRAENIKDWLNEQIKELEFVTNNTSLKLYITEVFFKEKDAKITDEAAQITFLRNYISSVAQKNNYISHNIANKIPANLVDNNINGIAILNTKKEPLVSTFQLANLPNEVIDFISLSENGKISIKDIFFYENNKPMIAFIIPIYSIQGTSTASDQIGSIFAIKNVGNEIAKILQKPTSPEKTAESYLISYDKDKKSARYISQLRDQRIKLGTKIQNTRIQNNRKMIGYSILEDSQTSGIANDASGNSTLFTSKDITDKNQIIHWKLIHKINENEALQASKSQKRSMISISILLISSLIIAIIAIWQHSSSVKYQRLAQQFKSQELLLRLVTDNQPDATYIVDENSICRFANISAARNYSTSRNDLIGKSLIQIADENLMGEYLKAQKYVLSNNTSTSQIRKIMSYNDKKDMVIKSNYIPLDKIPRVIDGKNSKGILVVETDITDVIEEKEKRERVLKQLVDTVVRLVDTRDSNSAKHSQKVSLLAGAIAKEMNLPAVQIDAVTVAGEIMNIGKIFLPISLLTKEKKLTKSEMKQISDAIFMSHEIVKDIEFDAPVVETLRQSQESFDGKGRLKMQGDEILITARIINVANIFVAMSSNRSYRKKIEYDKILQYFMQEANYKYDRKVIISLANYIEKNEKYVNEIFF